MASFNGFLMLTVHLARLPLLAPSIGRRVSTTCSRRALKESAAGRLPSNVAAILKRRSPAPIVSLAVMVMTPSLTMMQLLKSTPAVLTAS